MAKTAAVVLADGFETIEALTSVDTLRRAGVEVQTVSINKGPTVTSAHKVPVLADTTVGEVDLGAFDLLILPGGQPGTDNLGRCAEVEEAVKGRMAANLKVSAICAAPSLLAKWGLLNGRVATCYPGCEGEFPAGVRPEEPGVFFDGNLITATGPAYALAFGLANVETLMGKAKADEVAQAMLVRP